MTSPAGAARPAPEQPARRAYIGGAGAAVWMLLLSWLVAVAAVAVAVAALAAVARRALLFLWAPAREGGLAASVYLPLAKWSDKAVVKLTKSKGMGKFQDVTSGRPPTVRVMLRF